MTIKKLSVFLIAACMFATALRLFLPDTVPASAGEISGEVTPAPDSETGEAQEPTLAQSLIPPTFRYTTVTMYPGWDTYEVFVDNIPEEVDISYKSSKKTVATINSYGIITAKKKGTATITATVTYEDGSTASCKMKVVVKNPYYTVTSTTEGISVGGSYTFSVTRHGNSSPVTWSLTGSQYASIEAVSATDCTITGLAAGDTVLTVTSEGISKSFDVRVYDQGRGTVFVIHPDSEPYNGNYTSRSDYNDKTRHYYLVRSYLERLSAIGGGMLVFSAGDYEILTTLCIPSDTTILLEDGARIVKTGDASGTWLTASMSLFQTVAYSHTTTKFSSYNGEHDISILGLGSATIDMNLVPGTAVVAAHIRNLKIDGIRFINLSTQHFIELDAATEVYITNNLFNGYTPTSTGRKEAINIDTPDSATKGFIQSWTSYDCTPVLDVFITDNTFYDLEAAIGTHKYSEGYYHTNINILRNSFIDVRAYAIRAMNWDSPVITDNYFCITGVAHTDPIPGAGAYGTTRDETDTSFDNTEDTSAPDADSPSDPGAVDSSGTTTEDNPTGETEGSYSGEDTGTSDAEGETTTVLKLWQIEDIAVILNGCVNPVITGNYIRSYDVPIACFHWKNSGNGKRYAITYNDLDNSALAAMKKNYLAGCTKAEIDYYDIFDDFSDESLKVFTINKRYIVY